MNKDLIKVLNELESCLPINKHDLDQGLVEQPESYHKAAEQHALYKSEKDTAKQNLLEIESEVDLEIRREARNRKEKITETEIASEKRLDKRVQKAQDELLKVSHAVNLLSAFEKSFEQRSDSLKGLTQLYIRSYYEESSQDRVQRNISDIKVDQHREQIGKRLSRGER